jgi:acyl-CoA synthetase (AMP-forming)/AMP-acid ligase II
MAPEITATRFFEAEGRRWYRTGDVGKYDPKLGYLFKGRVDHQVKIRGFRVELQEIESVIRRASGCDVVAVLPWPTTTDGGATGCVAFVMGTQARSESITAECAKFLPDYMVPQHIIAVRDMPLNSNGKVDYVALRSHPSLATLQI